MKRLLVITLLFTIFLVFPNLAKAEFINFNGISGDIYPYVVDETGILQINPGFNNETDFDKTVRLRITIDPHPWNGNGYNTVATAQIKNVYVASDGHELIEGKDIITTHFRDSTKGSVNANGEYTGDMPLETWEFKFLFDKQKVKEGHALTFYFENYKLLKEGWVRVDYYLYDSDNAVQPFASNFISFPIYAHDPSGQILPRPTAVDSGSDINNGPKPTIIIPSNPDNLERPSQHKDRDYESLQKQVEKLQNDQGQIIKDIEENKSFIQKIIAFLSKIFGNFFN